MNGRLWIAFGVVVASALGLLAWNTASLPLFDPDEARFARTSVEMLRNHDPVVPQFESRPRLVKPPLVHWVQSFLFGLFGVGEGVARLHAVLATLLSVLIVGWVARLRFGAEAAVWSAGILASMPLVVALGHFGTIDALLAVHVLAVVALDLTSPDETGPYSSIAMGALIGFAFLAKGPVGVVLPLLIMLAGRTAARREIFSSIRGLGLALAAWCVVVLPWGLAFIRRIGMGEVISTLDVETLERFRAGTDHVQPWWFYVVAMAVGFLPWMGPLVAAMVEAIVRRSPRGSAASYCAAGLLAGLVFLSLGKGKLPSYILPLAPLGALLTAWQVGEDLKRSKGRGWAQSLLVVSLLGLAVAFGAAGRGRDEATIQTVGWIGTALYGAGTVVAGLGWILRRPRVVYGTALVTALSFLFVLVGMLLPQISTTHTSAYLIRSVGELSTDRPVVVVDMKLPSLTFYLDRVPEQVDLVRLEARVSDRDGALFVFDEDDLVRTSPEIVARLREVGRQGKYVVLEAAPGVPDER